MLYLILVLVGIFMMIINPKLALCVMVSAVTYGIFASTAYAVPIALVAGIAFRILLMFFKV